MNRNVLSVIKRARSARDRAGAVQVAPGGKGGKSSEFWLIVGVIVLGVALFVLDAFSDKFSAELPGYLVGGLTALYTVLRFILKLRGASLAEADELIAELSDFLGDFAADQPAGRDPDPDAPPAQPPAIPRPL